MTTKSPKTAKAAEETVAGTEAADSAGTKAKAGKTPTTSLKARQRPAVVDDAAKTERKARADTKQAKLIAMLEAKDGATVEEIAAAFGWQAHTVRGVLYGALKK
jgi:hypothetical protein